MRGDLAKTFELTNTQMFRRAPLPKSYTDFLGHKLFLFVLTVQGLGAFALITLGVILKKSGVAGSVIQPRVRQEISRAGVALLPMFLFVALALGFLVVGQTVSALARVGATGYLGSTMVIVIVRELGPLLAAVLVLARVGTAHVIELGTARALGEVEALEALGIDPVHYLIVPRVIGMALGMFSLTVYLILGALASGYPVRVFAGCAVDAGRLLEADRRGARVARFRVAGAENNGLRLFHRHRVLLPRPRPAAAAGGRFPRGGARSHAGRHCLRARGRDVHRALSRDMSDTTFSPAVIEIRGADVGAMRDVALTVVSDVNWSVLPGEFWVVAGQQQSGKSDLLMLAAGLLAPQRGSCRVFGCDTEDFGEAQIAERLRVGFVFTGGQLFNQLTVAENVALPLRYQKNLAAAEAARVVETLLEMLELTPFAGFMPSNLTANWRQRAALARALILKPELLLLDNPLARAGGRHRQWLLQFLDLLWRGHEWFGGRPMTIVASTDDLRLWRDAKKQFAVLHEKSFSVVGSWNKVAAASSPAVKELLAEPAGAII